MLTPQATACSTMKAAVDDDANTTSMLKKRITLLRQKNIEPDTYANSKVHSRLENGKEKRWVRLTTFLVLLSLGFNGTISIDGRAWGLCLPCRTLLIGPH